MRSCADCGRDISDRALSAYLCKPCATVRAQAGRMRRYRAIMSDPALVVEHRRKRAEWAREHYVPVANPKKTIERCQAVGCKRKWVRVWHSTNRVLCDDCRQFYNREQELEYGRRHRKARRAA